MRQSLVAASFSMSSPRMRAYARNTTAESLSAPAASLAGALRFFDVGGVSGGRSSLSVSCTYKRQFGAYCTYTHAHTQTNTRENNLL